MLRQCILNAKNQSYDNYIHSVGIMYDLEPLFSEIVYDDLYSDKLIINDFANSHTHFNNINVMKAVPDYEDYDIYIKMDDDDVYKANYVKSIVEFFKANPDTDIVSSNIVTQINGENVYLGQYSDLGNLYSGDYRMPMTYAFNKKAFNAIKNLESKDISGYDDMTWRMHWNAHRLKASVVNNEYNIVWHIHGDNTSTASFLRK